MYQRPATLILFPISFLHGQTTNPLELIKQETPPANERIAYGKDHCSWANRDCRSEPVRSTWMARTKMQIRVAIMAPASLRRSITVGSFLRCPSPSTELTSEGRTNRRLVPVLTEADVK